jgi:Fumarylacetoacetate (FAA) hydrolase family
VRLASHERDGGWAAAVALSGDRVVDAAAAARHAGLDDDVLWTSVRAIIAALADRVAALAEAAEGLAHDDPEASLSVGDVRSGRRWRGGCRSTTSARATCRRRRRQWTVGKSPDTFGPCGPYLVLDDAMRDGGLELETQVNGEQVQHAHTDQMIFSAARLATPGSHVTRHPERSRMTDDARMRTTHVGSLVRPDELVAYLRKIDAGGAVRRRPTRNARSPQGPG